MIFKLTLLSLILAFFSLVSLIFWARYSPLKGGYQNLVVEKIPGFELEDLSQKESLKVASWNFAFAFGMGSDGKDSYYQLSEQEYNTQFALARQELCALQADIVLVQEIDFASFRTHFHDQVNDLAQACSYGYVSRIKSWDINYVPFPSGLKRHFSKISSGGAIFSKIPLEKASGFLFDKPHENPFWYNWFYLYRYFQTAQFSWKNQKFQIFNVHLEAFQAQTRFNQIQFLYRHFQSLANNENNDSQLKLILGGDFNTVPSEAFKVRDFPDYPEDNYENDGCYDALTTLTGVKDVLTQEEYRQKEQQFLTFPAPNPDRKLDYFFISEDLNSFDFQVHETQVSDHRPISFILKF